MAENVVESAQRLIQDERFDGVERRFKSLQQQIDAQFKAVLSAIGESRAQSELATVRELSELRERVAVLEAQRH
jgi:hypothetical protein